MVLYVRIGSRADPGDRAPHVRYVPIAELRLPQAATFRMTLTPAGRPCACRPGYVRRRPGGTRAIGVSPPRNRAEGTVGRSDRASCCSFGLLGSEVTSPKNIDFKKVAVAAPRAITKQPPNKARLLSTLDLADFKCSTQVERHRCRSLRARSTTS